MLSELFYWVLNASIIGALCGLILLLLRKAKSIPCFAIYLLWMIPMIRFWLPFGLANQYSFLSLLSRFATKTVHIGPETPPFTATNFIMGANQYFPIEYKSDLLTSIFNIASVIWIIIAIAAILTSIAIYWLTKSELQSIEHIQDNIYRSSKITVPAVYGVFKPKIILPDALVEGNIDYILLHERIHINRKDNLWRIVAVITACVHWYNPLVWLFLKCFFIDMELACDNKVLKSIDDPREYASAVLSAAQGKAIFTSAFGGAKTRIRIENILSYKKLTLASLICFKVLIAAIAVSLTANAV